MARRTKSRNTALQMLYQHDVNPDVGGKVVRAQIAEELSAEDLQVFAWHLFAGVMEFRAQIDAAIEAVAENWRLERMAVTDRNVLRIGAFELMHTDSPWQVVIDEAVEMARRFGSKQSPQFVNGILDKLVPEDRRAETGET